MSDETNEFDFEAPRVLDMRNSLSSDSSMHEVMRAALLAMNEEFNSEGWDQRDKLLIVKISDEPHSTEFGMLGFHELGGPGQGELTELMPGLAGMLVLSSAIPGMKSQILGDYPGSTTVGAVMSFEAWVMPRKPGETEPPSVADFETSPEKRNARHLVMCLYDGTLFHLTHMEGEEPEWVEGKFAQEPTLLVGLLRVITAAAVQP
jgi:hypothetical protein